MNSAEEQLKSLFRDKLGIDLKSSVNTSKIYENNIRSLLHYGYNLEEHYTYFKKYLNLVMNTDF